MIHYAEAVQGSPEWAMARCGIPTASEFSKVITPTGKPSTQYKGYAYRLLAELMIKEPIQTFESTYWIDRGKTLEADAVGMYEFNYGVETQKAGFCTTDDGYFGASPDRFVGTEGLLECKCPAPQTHMEYLINRTVDKDYICQLQGQLLVTGYKWVDIWSYHPQMPPVQIRIERDEAFIEALAAELGKLRKFMNDAIQSLVDQGLWDLPIKEAA